MLKCRSLLLQPSLRLLLLESSKCRPRAFSMKLCQQIRSGIVLQNHYCRNRNFATILSKLEDHDSEDNLNNGNSKVWQNENEYAYRIFQNSDYRNCTVKRFNDVSELKSQTVRSCVQKFAEYAEEAVNNDKTILDPSFGDIFPEIIAEAPLFTDLELSCVLHDLSKFSMVSSTSTKNFRKVLDEQCSTRMSKWDFDYLLSMMDLWYHIGSSKFSNFHSLAVNKLIRKCDMLSKEQFIRLMFCINLCRNFPKSSSTYGLEHRLKAMINEISIKEIAIVCMGFFKTSSPIKDSSLLNRILARVRLDAENVDSFAVAAIAKAMRLSTTNVHSQELSVFQETFIPHVNRFSLTSCTHLALVGTRANVTNKKLISKVVQLFEKDAHSARLKELERILFAASSFHVECSTLCDVIIEQLRSSSRKLEVDTFVLCLPAILHYLSIKEVFPHDLIDFALSPQFVSSVYKTVFLEVQRQLASLDLTVELEVEGYKGHRLETAYRTQILKRNVSRLENPHGRITDVDGVLNDTVSKLKSIVGSKPLHVCSILPQYNSKEIVFFVNDQGQVAEIPSFLRLLPVHEPKYVKDKDSGRYHCLYLCTRSACNPTTKELWGQTKMHIRQLQKMGYTVHIIYVLEWLGMQSEQKLNHLRNVVKLQVF